MEHTLTLQLTQVHLICYCVILFMLGVLLGLGVGFWLQFDFAWRLSQDVLKWRTERRKG